MLSRARRRGVETIGSDSTSCAMSAPTGPPMARGAVLGAPCDHTGPIFGDTSDGQVLACPCFGHWSPTANWSGVHEIGSPCPGPDGSAVSPGGVALTCVSTSFGGFGT